GHALAQVLVTDRRFEVRAPPRHPRPVRCLCLPDMHPGIDDRHRSSSLGTRITPLRRLALVITPAPFQVRPLAAISDSSCSAKAEHPVTSDAEGYWIVRLRGR